MKWRAVGFLILIIIIVVVFAAVYVDRSRVIGVSSGSPPTPVLVAKQLIPKGTPGSLMARREMYVLTMLPQKEVEDDAISDPAWQSGLAADLDTFPVYLKGRAAAVDILPGQQLTETDFAASDASASP